METPFWELRCALSAFKQDADAFRTALTEALSKMDGKDVSSDMLRAGAFLEGTPAPIISVPVSGSAA